jgi:hypothetical protein
MNLKEIIEKKDLLYNKIMLEYQKELMNLVYNDIENLINEYLENKDVKEIRNDFEDLFKDINFLHFVYMDYYERLNIDINNVISFKQGLEFKKVVK